MRASDEQLRPIRDRGRDILGGSMQVDEWEIAVMHRTHHGECCRVSWLQGDLDAMTETFRVGILPELERTAWFLQRQPAGRTGRPAWAAPPRPGRPAQRWRPAARRPTTCAAGPRSDAGGEIVDVHEFDLAYAHLHVPEMA